ncbi:phosphatase PAP2 family protein [Sphingomonas sp. LHG3406-1]|uniref:phosphatase PAP2 family protein n=1 Tax=Sphingomonas sp. LHG3406-1 TaxID=2804617 RepID=UPI00261B4DFC|nr:phosphatase PAP2 family protein [Sphingomonas sp. LHG3406-1]
MTKFENLPDIEAPAPIEELDTAVADALLPIAGKAAVQGLGTVSDFSDQEPLYAASAAVLGTAALMRHGPTWRAGTRMLASHLLATALRGVVKQMVDRTRPDAAAERGEYVLRKGRRQDSDYNSFPSGHTAGALAFAMAVGRDYPAARIPALTLASAASLAQVVRSRHYVSDVVAGAVIGLAAEALVDALVSVAARD